LSAEDGDVVLEGLFGRNTWVNRDGQLEHWVSTVDDRIDF
jgi:hypothetical protein